jgi:hypothetical protein
MGFGAVSCTWGAIRAARMMEIMEIWYHGTDGHVHAQRLYHED